MKAASQRSPVSDGSRTSPGEAGALVDGAGAELVIVGLSDILGNFLTVPSRQRGRPAGGPERAR
ncbi:hypothetical protein GCM10009828_020770 [Actinoplanes couchii]|uniref:Uncharacterized protein n=1 Tax=Actinoplanes couchii TaxID=403638 RepID=A0ABQ3XHR8_9ACTN|nr:hypothetical protein Aco03nite_064290 [Actinoplanes couchii]